MSSVYGQQWTDDNLLSLNEYFDLPFRQAWAASAVLGLWPMMWKGRGIGSGTADDLLLGACLVDR